MLNGLINSRKYFLNPSCYGFVLFLLLLLSCSSTKKIQTPKESSSQSKSYEDILLYDLDGPQKIIVQEALNLIGYPYCYGGAKEDCFDCSGFVTKVFQRAGIKLPRTSLDQFNFGTYIEPGKQKPADLVFFKGKKNVNHVGIYLTNNIFIHASSTIGVTKASLTDDYFSKHFAGFRRVF